MAKRFTDSEKWKKPFIRSMKAPYKLLWLYILDECDHAGIWQVDLDVAQIKIGEKLKLEDARKNLAGKIYEFDGGAKWFIPDFIEFQYGELKEENRAHNSVIRLLDKHGLRNIKPLTSPLQGAMDMDKDKDKEKDKDKDKKEDVEIFETEVIKTELEIAFDSWIEMRKKIKAPVTPKGIELGKAELKRLAGGDEQLAIEIINQSILNNWKGFFPINKKQQHNGNRDSKADSREELYRESVSILSGNQGSDY